MSAGARGAAGLRARDRAAACAARASRCPTAPGLRPTPDRVRETLFNWLVPVIDGARCLDLFAGTGALGIEAASRGAREVRAGRARSRALAAALRAQLARLKVDARRACVGDDAAGATSAARASPLRRGLRRPAVRRRPLVRCRDDAGAAVGWLAPGRVDLRRIAARRPPACRPTGPARLNAGTSAPPHRRSPGPRRPAVGACRAGYRARVRSGTRLEAPARAGSRAEHALPGGDAGGASRGRSGS